VRRGLLIVAAFFAVLAGQIAFFLGFAESSRPGGGSAVLPNLIFAASLIPLVYLLLLVYRYTLTPGGPDHAVEQSVRASGPALVATTAAGARIGAAWLTALPVAVAIHPGGLWLKPPFSQPFAIPASSIRDARYVKRFASVGVQVEHSEPGVGSPIVLNVGRDERILAAVLDMASPQAVRPNKGIEQSARR